ncbi:MAG: glucuronate isomerase [Armatimonadetes bacterium]|nr:glucuronate isomerase [Armatimonadota bacterium]
MAFVDLRDRASVSDMVGRALADARITDIHTHIYPPSFGSILLWGMDEILTFHYLVAETMRWLDMPYDDFWKLSKHEQADVVWKTLFIDHSPVSEACRGVLTMLDALGLDVSSRDIESYRAYFARKRAEEHVDDVFGLVNIDSVVMTNDPFDDLERPSWLAGRQGDPRFHAALRLDAMLNSWETAAPVLRGWGYKVDDAAAGQSASEVRRFLKEWIDRMDAFYMAVSLPPSFLFPEDSARGRLIEECVLPIAAEMNVPFAPMIGVKKQVNPGLMLAGDSVGKCSIDVIEYLCRNYPEIRFLVTILSRENQHELCVAARKFRNLMVFGCWWFLNSPSIIEEMTRMRLELLGLSVIPQHSDARVLDQVIYKWIHSRRIIGQVLTDKYCDIAETGWLVSEDDIRRDVDGLLGGNFWRFLGRSK